MTRNLVTAAIVLLIALLAPATAIIGFCSRMPCCSQASDAAAAMSAERNDCCTTIACYESPSLKLMTAATAANALPVSPALATVAPPSPLSLLARASGDPSPPLRARQRLAILSTLVI
jgi:hypothetical protein